MKELLVRQASDQKGPLPQPQRALATSCHRERVEGLPAHTGSSVIIFFPCTPGPLQPERGAPRELSRRPRCRFGPQSNGSKTPIQTTSGSFLACQQSGGLTSMTTSPGWLAPLTDANTRSLDAVSWQWGLRHLKIFGIQYICTLFKYIII